MSYWIKCRAVASLVALTASTIVFAAEDIVPKRKPGLWEITTVAAGTGMTVLKACIGADENIALPSDSGDCVQTDATPAGSEVIVNVVCKRAYGKEIMSTAFGGDFSKHYHGVMKITFDPPEGVPNMGVTIDARYLGENCSGAGKSAP